MSEAVIKTNLDGVAALGSRVYPLVLPQTVAYPAATYQRISAVRPSAFGVDAGLVEAVIQVDVYGFRQDGYGAFNAVADSVRTALQRRSSGVVQDMYIDAERDAFEDDADLYRKSFDVRTWYRE